MPLPTDPGRINPPEDLLATPTALAAFELRRDLAAEATGRPRLFAALSSAGSNWSGAALYAEQGDGQLDPLGGSGRRRAVMGTASSALPPRSPLLFELPYSLAVTLIDPHTNLVSAATPQLAKGVTSRSWARTGSSSPERLRSAKAGSSSKASCAGAAALKAPWSDMPGVRLSSCWTALHRRSPLDALERRPPEKCSPWVAAMPSRSPAPCT